MKLNQFKRDIDYNPDEDRNLEVQFVGMKWQDECHPSAPLFPIEFVSAELKGKTVTVKFVTKPLHP